jgi:cytochrome c-type biogenesis protein CcmH
MASALLAVLLLSAVAVFAQDVASLTSPDVLRVGQRLACRCGGCRNTVGTCPMVRCGSSDPLRQRIYNMKQTGASDDDIVNTIVREDGIVALAAPPGEGLGLLTWVMPGVVLLIGFFVYQRWVRRNQKDPEPITAVDQAVLDRFHTQIERELDEGSYQDGSKTKK